MNELIFVAILYWSVATLLQWGGWWIANGVHLRLRQKQMQSSIDESNQLSSPIGISLSVIVPLHNERNTIISCIHAIQQIPANDLEIIIVDDGSNDGSRELVQRWFGRTCRIIQQSNQGKAAALNHGIRASSRPWVCIIDADTVVDPNGIRIILERLNEDVTPPIGAIGGAIRISPDQSWLANMQSIEYQRAFGIGLTAASIVQSVMLIPGACSIFSRVALEQSGGFRSPSLAEDMDMIMQIHLSNQRSLSPLRVLMLPHTVAYTEPVEKWQLLRKQRIRWHRGQFQSLTRFRRLLFQQRANRVSWLAYPTTLLFSTFQPLVVVCTICLLLMEMLTQSIPPSMILGAIGMWWLINLLYGMTSQLNTLEWNRSPELLKQRSRKWLLILLEPLLYRPLLTWWRLQALWHELIDRPNRWDDGD